ncbi:MAG TPA: hypothetical protein VGQ52_13730 [Gemmatimonadaceae bacterium]|nr:hypothetical protein [Gemmatimonadaceae bacterium]
MRTVTDADALIAAMAPRLRRLRFAVGGEVDPRGAPGSPEWFANYGYGPEHLFLNASLPQPAPISGAPPPRPSRGGGSSSGLLGGVLGVLGTLGAGRSLENARRGQQGAGDLRGMDTIERGAADTSGTNAWIDQDLANLPMPTADFGDADFWDQMHAGASDTSATDAWVNRELDDYAANMPIPTLDEQAPWTQRLGQGVRGSIGLLGGAAQGGVGGTGNMLRGGSDLYEATLGPSAMSGRAGNVGGILAGIDEGGVEGYGSAAANAADLAGSLGYGGIGKGAPVLGGLTDIYGGLQRGDARGYLQAASGAAQTGEALSSLAGGTSALSGAGGALSAAGKALPLVGGALSAYDAYNAAAAGDKKGAVMSGAQAGAAIGSVIPVVGTVVGAAIGAVVGLIGASMGDKQMASESYYGAYKGLSPDKTVRSWSQDQADGAMFEALKSHTKSGNAKRFQDVGEMYQAFGVSDNDYSGMQRQLGQFIRGSIEAAQQMGGLPKDPKELAKLDGQQIFYKIITPAMQAKIKEATGKDAVGWAVDRSGGDSGLHNMMADWTDYMTSHWDEIGKSMAAAPSGGGGAKRRSGMVMKKARGGALTTIYGR